MVGRSSKRRVLKICSFESFTGICFPAATWIHVGDLEIIVLFSPGFLSWFGT